MATRLRQPTRSLAPPIPIRERLSPEEIAEIKATFDLFDEEQKGTIDPIEINKILQQLGLDRRNHVVSHILQDLQVKNRPLTFDEFLDIVYNRLGDTKTKDGLKRVYLLYDTDTTDFIDLEKIRAVARELGQTMGDDELKEMMHNTHILNKTETNEGFTFEEFYDIITKRRA